MFETTVHLYIISVRVYTLNSSCPPDGNILSDEWCCMVTDADPSPVLIFCMWLTTCQLVWIFQKWWLYNFANLNVTLLVNLKDFFQKWTRRFEKAKGIISGPLTKIYCFWKYILSISKTRQNIEFQTSSPVSPNNLNIDLVNTSRAPCSVSSLHCIVIEYHNHKSDFWMR